MKTLIKLTFLFLIIFFISVTGVDAQTPGHQVKGGQVGSPPAKETDRRISQSPYQALQKSSGQKSDTIKETLNPNQNQNIQQYPATNPLHAKPDQHLDQLQKEQRTGLEESSETPSDVQKLWRFNWIWKLVGIVLIVVIFLIIIYYLYRLYLKFKSPRKKVMIPNHFHEDPKAFSLNSKGPKFNENTSNFPNKVEFREKPVTPLHELIQHTINVGVEELKNEMTRLKTGIITDDHIQKICNAVVEELRKVIPKEIEHSIGKYTIEQLSLQKSLLDLENTKQNELEKEKMFLFEKHLSEKHSQNDMPPPEKINQPKLTWNEENLKIWWKKDGHLPFPDFEKRLQERFVDINNISIEIKYYEGTDKNNWHLIGIKNVSDRSVFVVPRKNFNFTLNIQQWYDDKNQSTSQQKRIESLLEVAKARNLQDIFPEKRGLLIC